MSQFNRKFYTASDVCATSCFISLFLVLFCNILYFFIPFIFFFFPSFAFLVIPAFVHSKWYRGADKSLALPWRKQANVFVRMTWISFGALTYRKKNLMTARVSMLLKSRAPLTCFRACFLPVRAKDLSALRYTNRGHHLFAAFFEYVLKVNATW